MKMLISSFINDVDNFFTDLFSKLGDNFSLGTLGVLLIGIILGFLICATIYGILMIISLKNDKKVRSDKLLNIDFNEENINAQIVAVKQKFIDNTEGLTIKERFQYLGPTILETINTVANEYYPESKYPLYELTIDELTQFLGYLSKRIEQIFNKTMLKPFKKMTISQIFKYIDLQKQISENKAIKAANKLKLNKVSNAFFTIINYANPVYWFRKLVMGTTINMATRKICLVIIDIVGEETNKTYSKAIFNQERNITIKEIDNEYHELEGEVKDE